MSHGFVLRTWVSAVALLVLLAQAPAARADAGWCASGDTRLRIDRQLLGDAEILRLPVTQWPFPRAAVPYALSNAREHHATNSAVAAALARVRVRAAVPAGAGWSFDTGIRGGEPGLGRDFDTLAREDGELGAGFEYDQGRF
jgi:hypothetical protein